MLKHLRLENFKSWQRLDLKMAPFTGLFGTNSSGKSAILQYLLLLKQTTKATDRKLVMDFGGAHSYVALGGFRDVIFGHDTSLPLGAEIAWSRKEELVLKNPLDGGEVARGNTLTFRHTVRQSDKGLLTVENMSYQLGPTAFYLKKKEGKKGYQLLTENPHDKKFRFKTSKGRKWPLPGPEKGYLFPNEINFYYQNAGFLHELPHALGQLAEGIHYLGPLREWPHRQYAWSGQEPGDVGKRGELAIAALLGARKKGRYISRGRGQKKQTLEERVATWLKELGLIHSFRLLQIGEREDLFEVRVKKTASSAEVLLTEVGFGVSQILPVLTLCYFVPEGSVLLLEQPEIHLHPSVQAGLADVFIDAIKFRKIQIVLESHSEYLLTRLLRRIGEGQLPSDQIALHFCEFDASHSLLRNIQVDDYGFVQNWPSGFFGDSFGEMTAHQKAALKRKLENSVA